MLPPPRSKVGSPKHEVARSRAQTLPERGTRNYAAGGLSFGDALPSYDSATTMPPTNTATADPFLDFLSSGPTTTQPLSAPNPNYGAAGSATQANDQPRAMDDMFGLGFFGIDAPQQPATAAPVQAQPTPALANTSSAGRRKKKKKKNKGRDRAQTEGNDAMSPPSHPAPPPPIAEEPAATSAPDSGPVQPRRRMKEYNILKTFHEGVGVVKFKFVGNGRPKTRHLSLTEDNKFLVWKTRGAESFTKSADERKVYLGQIRSLTRNDPADLAALSGIRHKQLTFTVVYVHNDGEKTLNIMAYEPFHYQMIVGALEKLIPAINDPERDVALMTDLWVEFERDIVPDHVKGQKFKWEAADIAAGPDEIDAMAAGPMGDDYGRARSATWSVATSRVRFNGSMNDDTPQATF